MMQSNKLGAGLLAKIPTVLAEDNQLLGVQCTLRRNSEGTVSCIHNQDAAPVTTDMVFLGYLWIRTKKPFILNQDNKALLCNIGLHTKDCYKGSSYVGSWETAEYNQIKDTPWRHALFAARTLKQAGDDIDPTIVFPNVVSYQVVLNSSDWKDVTEEYLANVAVSLLKGCNKIRAYEEQIRYEWTDPSCIPFDDHLVDCHKAAWLKSSYLKKKETSNFKAI